MNFKRYDKKGLGALGAIIIVILLVVLAFIGATTAMPFVVDQGFKVGDTFNYVWTISDGTSTVSYTESNTVTAVTANTVTYHYVYSDDGLDGTYIADMGKVDSKTILDDWMFVNPSILPDERAYTVVMVGFTPMVVEAYTYDVGGVHEEFWLKPGTLFVVKAIRTEGANIETVILSETSLKWVMLI